MIPLAIRPAELRDATAACAVLRRSITELCTADHRGDPAILDRWLADKTPETVRGWITACGHTLLIANRADAVVAVGGMTAAGEITLNYVDPSGRFQGVSTAMLAALEDRLREQGVARSRLSSTATAHGFYRSRGYLDVGRSVAFGSLTEYHMAKQL
jgi:GNAT superfamily N-acetyltransferase